jgi:hypothetical protein
MSECRNDILNEIDTERKRQNDMWGNDFDKKNTPNDWVAYITRYVAEGAYDGSTGKYNPELFRTNLIKAATICVAAVEILDSQGCCAPRHYDN